jgi:predicted permease
MAGLQRLIAGLKALFRRQRDEQELDEELRAYLECSVAAKISAGMTPEDARRAARIELGSLESVKDDTRDAGWEVAAEHAWRDVRYALRTLRRSPMFAAVVVVTLTLGIGANTAIFSAVNAIMLRALPAERPEELVSVAALYPDGIEPFSYAAYRTIASEADAAHLVDVLAASPARRDALAIDGPPEAVDVKWVSGNYFTTLGVPAAAGRPLLASDDLPPPGLAVAVISDAFWTRRFGRDPSVVGRGVRVRGAAFVIVGVARFGFTSETPGENVDLWMPLTSQPNAAAWLWNGHSTTWLRILARRRPGVGLAQARAGLEPVYERLRRDMASGTESAEFRRSVLESRLVVSEASGGVSRLRDNLAPLLMILMGIVGLVLLVACANVATLMLTRAVARRREVAMRFALGARRGRLVRQGMIEALMLATCGGAGGFVVAIWGTSALSSQLSGVLPVMLDITPDRTVLMFAAAISCAAALLFGLLPMVSATRVDPLDALKSGGGGRGASRIPFGRTLVVAQIAVSLVLLVIAGLFVRSVMRLRDADLGFDPDRVVLFRVSRADQQPMSAEARRQLYRQLVARAASVAGVHGASASFSGLLSSETWRNVVSVEGFTPAAGQTPRTFVNAVTPAYFDVVRIAVPRGRAFTEADTEQSMPVAIVNAAFTRQFFGGTEPIGKRVGLCRSEACDAAATAMMEIIGVAEDAKYSDVRAAAPPLLYVAIAQGERNPTEIQVRTTGDVSGAASTLYRALTGADRRLAIVGMTIARDRVDASLATQHTIARVASLFGLLALTLAAVGLFGLVAYMSAQRTQEIGIRMALGADRRDVRRLVVGHTAWLVALGAALGTPAALALARLLSGLLYGVEPYDPVVLSLNFAVLACVALGAGYLPARRATRVDPLSALRTE